MAPELRAKLLLAEATKDGFTLLCYSELPRDNLRWALRQRGLLQFFDSLIYAELLPELTSNELRLLAAPSTLWLRQPDDIDYTRILDLLPKRRRLLPKAIRMKKALAQEVKFNTATDSPIPDSNED
jgi:hypothetical protein